MVPGALATQLTHVQLAIAILLVFTCLIEWLELHLKRVVALQE